MPYSQVMTRISPDDAGALAILASNPKTAYWERLVERIQDPTAKNAALVIVGRLPAPPGSDEAVLAEDVMGWARSNRTHHRAVA